MVLLFGARTAASLFRVIVLTGLYEWCRASCFVDIHASCTRVQLNIIDSMNREWLVTAEDDRSCLI